VGVVVLERPLSMIIRVERSVALMGGEEPVAGSIEVFSLLGIVDL